MGRKIYINEDRLKDIANARLLPQFIFQRVKTHNHSLGECPAFPDSDDYPFDYVILKEAFNEAYTNIEHMGLAKYNEEQLSTHLGQLLSRCREIERPLRQQLQKVCENTVNKLFGVPKGMVNIECTLIDKVSTQNGTRLKPESNDDIGYKFFDVNDIDFSKKSIQKRRIVDAIIQGGCIRLSSIKSLYVDEIAKLNESLPELYEQIMMINNYLLFIKEDKFEDNKMMQGSYVATHLGNKGNKSSIKAQGLIFPLLLHETLRGMFELFSSHGLPTDRKKAMFVIRKADFVMAEPWDMRLGIGIWDRLFGSVEENNLIPYVFTGLISLETEDFILALKEIFSETEQGDMIINRLVSDAMQDEGYQKFRDRIDKKNVDKSMINDSYFSVGDLESLIDDDDDDVNVIAED